MAEKQLDLRRLWDFLREKELNLVQVIIMDIIRTEPYTTTKALQAKVGMARQTLGIHHLSKLEARGLIRKESPELRFDQRYKVFSLTTSGEELMKELLKDIEQGGSCEL